MILSGKTVLITGGRRIGAGLARQLAERGMNIAVSYRTSREEMRTLVADCQQMGVQADAFQADLCSSLEAERLVDWTVETFGSIDILINLTSIYHPTPFSSLQPSYSALLGGRSSGSGHAPAANRRWFAGEDHSLHRLGGRPTLSGLSSLSDREGRTGDAYESTGGRACADHYGECCRSGNGRASAQSSKKSPAENLRIVGLESNRLR